jgi:hypothetical protein
MVDGISNFERKRVKNLVNCSFHCSSALLQSPNFAWRSCSNRREKHRMTFANVVEGCLIYNFRIYLFFCTVQLFGETRKVVLTGWKTARPRSRAPPERRRAAWRPAPRATRSVASVCVLARCPLPRGTGHQPPSRWPPRSASRRLGARVASYGRRVLPSGPSPDPLLSAPTEARRRTAE